jgi:hypothetical protein
MRTYVGASVAQGRHIVFSWLQAEASGSWRQGTDDAISSGTSVERFTASLTGVGAEVVAVFVLVDMRDVGDTVSLRGNRAPDRFGEHVSTGSRPRHRQRPARSGPQEAHGRRDREPMDRRRSALPAAYRRRRRT